MSQPLQAMLVKLSWQLNELNLHLHEVQKKIQTVEQQIGEIDQHMNQTGLKSLLINPEFEINRLNFITQQQEKKIEMVAVLKDHHEVEAKLNDKILRVKTELKMLEKYLDREALSQKEQQKKAQDNAMDEWVIQRRE